MNTSVELVKTPMTFHFRVGNFSCLAIQDGICRLPRGLFLTSLPAEQCEPWLRERGYSVDEVEFSYNCLLIDTGRERILVDTGLGGENLFPVKGNLVKHLRAEHVEPGDIDLVVLSHAHVDHLGGNLDENGKSAFPKARYVLFRQEWEYWMSNPSVKELAIPEEFRRGLATVAEKNLSGVRPQLELLSQEGEIVEGVSALAAFGHSPGQMAVEISSAGEELLFVADTLIHPINLDYPGTIAAVDHQPNEMLATRRRLLERAAKRKALVATSHFAFPGLRYVSRNGERWEWKGLGAARKSEELAS